MLAHALPRILFLLSLPWLTSPDGGPVWNLSSVASLSLDPVCRLNLIARAWLRFRRGLTTYTVALQG